jgi:hypothetical protein
MPMSHGSPNSELRLRWLAWQEKGKIADRLSGKRMKILFSIVGIILLSLILYYVFRINMLPDSDHVQRAVACGGTFCHRKATNSIFG